MRRLAAVLLVLLLSSLAIAQSPNPQDVSTSAALQGASAPGSSQSFDVEAAVNAYLASVPPEARARSDAYFEGGYWLLLWDFLYGTAIALVLLTTGLSAKMRDLSERITRFTPLQTAIYWIEYLVITSVLAFPLAVYEGFFRERKYGLMNQTFGGWFGDQFKGMVVGLILGSIAVTALFAIVRRLPRTWWVWGTVASIVFLMFTALIGPVYIAPMFNKYTKLEDPRIKEPILAMARANGIPAHDVWQVDASRQSKRISANVSGFLGTERITLNDNLLNRCTPAEIQAVMAHEMGHYVLNHIYKSLMFFLIEALVFFAFLRWALKWSLARWGARWGIRGIGDTAVLPLVVLLASVFFFVVTPVNNSWIRTQEYEADMFGLNAARQPDGKAKVSVKLGEYRKLDPGRLEEIIFFDHPSGRTRITAAMRFKAEHMNDGGGQSAGK
ncbi:MAG TPA: M48 family metallopeptidase [Terriglobales bacterium]|nr:M48 family metallopeptidase [Terriglobales bacterium]